MNYQLFQQDYAPFSWLVCWITGLLDYWFFGLLVCWITGFWITSLLVGWLIEWLVRSLIGWFVDWLVDWLVGRLLDWLIGWLVDRFVGGLINLLFGCLVDWLVDCWSIVWLAVSLIGWLICLVWSTIDWSIHLVDWLVNWLVCWLVKCSAMINRLPITQKIIEASYLLTQHSISSVACFVRYNIQPHRVCIWRDPFFARSVLISL